MRGRNKKTQVILIFIGLTLIISTYFYYPSKNKEHLSKDTPKQLELNETESVEENTFQNVEYKMIDGLPSKPVRDRKLELYEKLYLNFFW